MSKNGKTIRDEGDETSAKEDEPEPDINIEEPAAELAAPDTTSQSEDATASATVDNTATFPLTRTFVHCDSTGRELAHVTVTATVTLTRVNGVALTLNEIERRFRRNFYLSFKGGKVSLKELSALMNTKTAPEKNHRTLSSEHKQKLQEARQRRRGQDRQQTSDGPDPAITELATTLLDGLSPDEWFGKADVLYACGIIAIEPASWTLAIRYLLDTNQIEARGEKRGREYRRLLNRDEGGENK